nr:zinc finger, CCHC-type [Tanacetum cinerariifolium]
MCSATVAKNAVTTAMAITGDVRLRSWLPRVCWIKQKEMYLTLLEGHSILSLKGSLSGDCDVEKNGKWSWKYAVGSQEYQMVCTILDIASADVGMFDKFDRGLQTNVHVLWILTTPWEDQSLSWVDKSQGSTPYNYVVDNG